MSVAPDTQSLWARLAQAAKTPSDPMSRMAVASVDAGGPDLRMVVLREARARDRSLCFHTDRRSPKCAAIAADPRVVLLFWDAQQGQQLRCRAFARLIGAGAAADAAWAALTARQRALYDAPHAPGSKPDGPPTPPQGRDAFRLVECRVSAMDVLHLRDDGQERWRIEDASAVAPVVRAIAP